MDKKKQREGISNFQTTAYSLGAMSREISYACVNLFYLAFLNIYMGLDVLVLTIAFVLIRVIDALCNPLLAAMINNSRQGRLGRYRPWMLIGGILNGASLVLMFLPLTGIGSVFLVHAFYIAIFLFWSLTFTLLEVPFWSMIPAIADSADDRNKITSLSRMIGAIGGFAITSVGTSLIIPKIAPARGAPQAHFVLGIVTAAMIILFILGPSLFNKERYELPVHKIKTQEVFGLLRANDQLRAYAISYLLFLAAVNTAILQIIYIFIYYGDMGGLGLLSQGLGYTVFSVISCTGLGLAMMFYQMIVKKIPGEKIYAMNFFVAVIGMAAMFFIFFLLKDHYGPVQNSAAKWINVVLVALAGAFLMTSNGLNQITTTVMAADITDYNEWKTGRRGDSVIFSIQTMIVKLSLAIAMLVIGVGIKAARLPAITQQLNEAANEFVYSFVDEAETVVSFGALHLLRVFMFLAPIPLCIIGYFVYRRKYWLYGKRYEEIKREVDERRNGEQFKV